MWYLAVIYCYPLPVAVLIVSKLLFLSLTSTCIHSLLVEKSWLSVEGEATHSRVFLLKFSKTKTYS